MTRVRDDALTSAFGAVLTQVRLGTGLSQEQLALRAAVNRTFVGKLENGKNQPSLAVVFSLSQALGMAPAALVAMVQERLDGGGGPPASQPTTSSAISTGKSP